LIEAVVQRGDLNRQIVTLFDECEVAFEIRKAVC